MFWWVLGALLASDAHDCGLEPPAIAALAQNAWPAFPGADSSNGRVYLSAQAGGAAPN